MLGPARIALIVSTLAVVAGCSPVPGASVDAAEGGEGPTTKGAKVEDDRNANPALTLEEVATYPKPGTLEPNHVAFSPDDATISYLESPDKSLSRELIAFDPATGARTMLFSPPGGGITEDNLSREEKLRRERQRVRGLGVTTYAWAKEQPRLLVPQSSSVYVQDGAGGTARELLKGDEHPILDPQLSRDGAWVAYVHDDELHVIAADGKSKPRQLTEGARGTGKTHGLAEYIAQEEMHRSHGFWWSWDASMLAFTEVDETHIPVYRIVHQGKDETGDGAQEDHRYPFAGRDNAKVRLGVVKRTGGEPVWMDLTGDDSFDFEYLARVHWMPDGRLLAQLEDRAQQVLRLVSFDPKTGASRVLLHERSDTWINLQHAFRPLEGDAALLGEAHGGFLWASERSGFNHLYLHAADGRQLAQLTAGGWPIDAVVAVDEARKRVYFTAGRGDPTQRHLHVVGFDGEGLRQITREPGFHDAVIDHAHERFVDIHQSPEAPARLTLRALEDGAVLRELPQVEDPRVAALHLRPPQLVKLQSRDGVDLHGAVYAPEPGLFGEGPYPTVVSVYGGPHAQMVSQTWGMTADLRAQFLAAHGYLVFKLDNRGSARRGLEFEGALRRDMGNIEVQDQVDGVRWLVAQGLTDPGRVAIYGWSYGGYMAAMALCRAPDTFQVGIAGAPVSSWDGYDTHYTERYMGTPEGNGPGYEAASVMSHVDGLRGKLLLVHGLIDENVHFRHTARLINGLISARKPYELLLFPDERHMPRQLDDRVHMEQQIFDFLRRSL